MRVQPGWQSMLKEQQSLNIEQPGEMRSIGSRQQEVSVVRQETENPTEVDKESGCRPAVCNLFRTESNKELEEQFKEFLSSGGKLSSR